MHGLKCDDCHASYGDDVMPISLNLSREQWLMIAPDDGLLCANCMVKRASSLPQVICVQARIMFAEDYA